MPVLPGEWRDPLDSSVRGRTDELYHGHMRSVHSPHLQIILDTRNIHQNNSPHHFWGLLIHYSPRQRLISQTACAYLTIIGAKMLSIRTSVLTQPPREETMGGRCHSPTDETSSRLDASMGSPPGEPMEGRLNNGEPP